MSVNTATSTLGRFSAQMLTYLGTQRTVQNYNGAIANTFKYANGPIVYPSPDSILRGFDAPTDTGNYSPDTYNTITCFNLANGANNMYADTMAALTIDVAASMSISPVQLLFQSGTAGVLSLQSAGYASINQLRDPGNQIGNGAPISNSKSLIAGQIRA